MDCLLCGKTVERPGLCSSSCVAAAKQEIERNVVRYRRVPPDADGDLRYSIATRNGILTSAVLSWGSGSAEVRPRDGRSAAPAEVGERRPARKALPMAVPQRLGAAGRPRAGTGSR